MQVTTKLLIETLSEVESVIVSRYSRKLAMVSARFGIDDLLQTVAMKAHVSLESCQAETAEELRHWVLTIARNAVETVITANRASKRSTLREGCAIGVATDESRDGYQPAAPIADPATATEVKEQCEAMLAVVETLPELQAKCLRMRYLEQMEYDEIAKVVGCSAQAVRSVVSRGLAKARTKLVAA